MTTWHLDRGQWTETTFYDDAWADASDGDDWAKVCKRLGYEEYTGIGSSSGAGVSAFSVEVYRREGQQPKFLVQISDLNMYDIRHASLTSPGLRSGHETPHPGRRSAGP